MKQQQSHWTGGYGNVRETIRTKWNRKKRNRVIKSGRDREIREKKQYIHIYKIHRQRGWIVLVWLVYLFNFNTRWAFGVIISALSKIRITSTEHYMCIHILLSHNIISLRLVFFLLVLSFLLFFRFFLSLFYLIPVWFLLRSHFSLFSHTVILHKATNYFYTQPDVMTEYRRFVFCVSLASLLFCWDRANDPLCLYSLFDGTWNCKITKVNKFRYGKM